MNPNTRQEQFEGVTYTFHQLWFGGGIEPSGALRVEFFGNVGQSVDYANGRLADQLQLNPEVGLRIGPRIDLQLRHSFRRLSFEGRTIVDANVSQLRGVYNFTPRTFFRAIVQHRSTGRQPSLYRDAVDRFQRSILTQFLFSYKLNPQSVLFVGYGDARGDGSGVLRVASHADGSDLLPEGQLRLASLTRLHRVRAPQTLLLHGVSMG